jgi:hypothetical protein
MDDVRAGELNPTLRGCARARSWHLPVRVKESRYRATPRRGLLSTARACTPATQGARPAGLPAWLDTKAAAAEVGILEGHFGDPRWLGPHSGELTVKIGWRPDGMAWRAKKKFK